MAAETVSTNHFIKWLDEKSLDVKDYQTDGVQWMIRNETMVDPPQNVRGGIIADEMGVGKTIQMLGVIFTNPVKRTLIVLPKSLVGQWAEAVDSLSPKEWEKCVVYTGLAKKKISHDELMDARVVITTYGGIADRLVSPPKILPREYRSSELISIPWSRVVFDEGHFLRTPSNLATSGAVKLTSQIKWIMTGTPIQNKKRDFYSLCNVLGLDSSYYTNSENLIEFAQNFLLRRTKESVGLDIPELKITSETVAWETPKEREIAYQLHEKHLFKSVTSQNVNTLISLMTRSHLPALLRMRQVCVLPQIIEKYTSSLRKSANTLFELLSEDPDVKDIFGIQHNDEIADVVDKVVEVNTDGACSKMNAVIAAVEKRITNGNHKIIFTHFREEMAELKRRLEKLDNVCVQCMSGGTTIAKRVEMMKPIEETDKRTHILVLQIRTASEGLNLQHYNEVYFVSPHWNPAVEEQAIARCWRKGQKKVTHVFRFIMEGFGENLPSIEEYCVEIQEKKRELQRELKKYQK